jgi:hypothetical protein
MPEYGYSRPNRFTRGVLRKVAESTMRKEASRLEGLEMQLHKIKSFCEARAAGKRVLIARALQLCLEFIERSCYLTISSPLYTIRRVLVRFRNIDFDIQPGGQIITLFFGAPKKEVLTKQEDMMVYGFRPCSSKLVIWCNNIIGSQGGEIHLKDGTTITLESYVPHEG